MTLCLGQLQVCPLVKKVRTAAPTTTAPIADMCSCLTGWWGSFTAHHHRPSIHKITSLQNILASCVTNQLSISLAFKFHLMAVWSLNDPLPWTTSGVPVSEKSENCGTYNNSTYRRHTYCWYWSYMQKLQLRPSILSIQFVQLSRLVVSIFVEKTRFEMGNDPIWQAYFSEGLEKIPTWGRPKSCNSGKRIITILLRDPTIHLHYPRLSQFFFGRTQQKKITPWN